MRGTGIDSSILYVGQSQILPDGRSRIDFLEFYKVQYNLGNPTYMGPRYRRITENDGVLEKSE
jgi:hypothetical protein